MSYIINNEAPMTYEQTEIFKTLIFGYEELGSVALANKMKGLLTHYNSIKEELKVLKAQYPYDDSQLDTAIYECILKFNNFKHLGREVKCAYDYRNPKTFIFSKTKEDTTTSDNKRTKRIEYACVINHKWLNEYVAFIKQTLIDMGDKLTSLKKQSKEKIVLQKKEYSNTMVKCECGKSYNQSHKNRHFDTAIHKKNMKLKEQEYCEEILTEEEEEVKEEVKEILTEEKEKEKIEIENMGCEDELSRDYEEYLKEREEFFRKLREEEWERQKLKPIVRKNRMKVKKSE